MKSQKTSQQANQNNGYHQKSYEAFQYKPPNQDVQGRYSESTFTEHLKQTEANLHNVYMILFWGALPKQNCHIVMQQNKAY
jgi:hypothetical protein